MLIGTLCLLERNRISNLINFVFSLKTLPVILRVILCTTSRTFYHSWSFHTRSEMRSHALRVTFHHLPPKEADEIGHWLDFAKAYIGCAFVAHDSRKRQWWDDTLKFVVLLWSTLHHNARTTWHTPFNIKMSYCPYIASCTVQSTRSRAVERPVESF